MYESLRKLTKQKVWLPPGTDMHRSLQSAQLLFSMQRKIMTYERLIVQMLIHIKAEFSMRQNQYLLASIYKFGMGQLSR